MHRGLQKAELERLLRNTFWPVSYTHLDVYKRQGRTRGGKRFVSSTYFIKEKGHLVGLICVNHDVEDILVLSEHLSNLLHSFSLPQEEESSAYTENLDDSIPELSSNLIHSTILGYGIPLSLIHICTADTKTSSSVAGTRWAIRESASTL